MRSDMHEVVIERPRWGRKFAPIAVRRARRHFNDPRSFDDAPAIGPTSRHYGHNRKGLTDLLGPLKRFLRSRVGRRWDDVYSEACTGLRKDTVTHLHILGHLEDMVVKTTWMQHGVLMGANGWGVPTPVAAMASHWSPRFYVDAKGVLRESKPKTKKQKAQEQRRHVVMKHGIRAVKRNGVWFHIVLERVPAGQQYGSGRWVDGKYLPTVFDVVLGKPIQNVLPREAKEMYGTDQIYAARLGNQLDKKTLTKLGLRRRP